MKTLLLSLLCAAPLHATTILVDFGTATTTGTPSYWNNFTVLTDGASLALQDTSNAATTYLIALSGGDINGLTDNSTAVAATYAPFTPTTVIQDSVFQSSGRSFTLSGLNPATSYTITLFSYVDRNTHRDTTFSITGQPTLTSHPSGDPTAAFASGGDTVTFNAVTPTSGGVIKIDVANLGGNWILNGMEITYTVPEPAAAMLAGLGLLPLLRRRR